MPLKLNIGFSKKIGESNYGSRGAVVNLEIECDSGLVDQPDQLKERIRQMFQLAKASVEEELNGNTAPKANGHPSAQQGNGQRRDTTRKATASQMRAIQAIAQRQQLDPAKLVHSRYGVDKPKDLSITQASELIDSLKASSNGTRGRR